MSNKVATTRKVILHFNNKQSYTYSNVDNVKVTEDSVTFTRHSFEPGISDVESKIKIQFKHLTSFEVRGIKNEYAKTVFRIVDKKVFSIDSGANPLYSCAPYTIVINTIGSLGTYVDGNSLNTTMINALI